MTVLVEERTAKIKTLTTPANKTERVTILPEEERRVIDRPGFQLAMGAVPEHEEDCPPEEIVRGRCPECGGQLVANLYYHLLRGYLLRYECWEGLMLQGRCEFYTVP